MRFIHFFINFSCTVYFFDIPLHHQTRRDHILVQKTTLGEVAEWSIAPVLKTDVPRGTGGSNPSLSALKQISLRSLLFLFAFSINLIRGNLDKTGDEFM